MKKSFVLPLLVIGLALVFADQVTAQTFKTLYNFTDGTEAGGPHADLILKGNILYGTTLSGGSLSLGNVFALNTDGTGFTNLYDFTGGSDGANPGSASLVSTGNTLFGTAKNGGTAGSGTVFSINSDGTGFMSLYTFTGGTDGANPWAGMILLSNALYGTTEYGGSSGNGTVFCINTDGTGFTNLYSFTGGADGAKPLGGLILLNNTLYGTTFGGGSSSNGTLFAINTDGSSFNMLHDFTGGSDGAGSFVGLTLSGHTLYGTTARGGISGHGTVFKVNTDGNGFTTLHSFSGITDGSGPHARLILSGSTLYGTAATGGSLNQGTVFSINTDGTGFVNLYNFTFGTDGASPEGGLVLVGNALYGTTITSGGASGTSRYGTVFRILLPVVRPQLTITPSAGNLILTWPTVITGFTVQSTTNLASPVWTTNLQAPVVVNGQNTATNSISGAQQFFRLSQ